MINSNDKRAEDQIEDHNKIGTILHMTMSMKILKLVMLILNCSFYFGMVWLIICITLEDIRLNFSDVIGHDEVEEDNGSRQGFGGGSIFERLNNF